MRAIHWFRADLRLRDNAALCAAASAADELIPIFVLDDRLLRGRGAGGPRTRFLLEGLARLGRELAARGSRLVVRRGDPAAVIARLLHETKAETLSFNLGHGPTAAKRDAAVATLAAKAGVRVLVLKDAVMFASDEIRTKSGGPYAVYTPYRNAWRARLHGDPQPPGGVPKLPRCPEEIASEGVPSAAALGLGDDAAALPEAGPAAGERRLDAFLGGAIRDYAERRDLPAADATSRLSPYLRFGMVSIRACVHGALELARREKAAAAGASKWLDELVWREFYVSILDAHPRVLRESYRREFDAIAWNEDPEAFAAWREGRTGYPIVDAGMRQLAREGWMHNRVRMIVASFLTKDLLIDWRLGERFFFRRLVDGDPASNNGGWQWAASTGTDAQPYFRIFNPVSQGERVDPDGVYVRRFVPEIERVERRFVHRPWEAPDPPAAYPAPIVSHAERRLLALARYEAARARARA